MASASQKENEQLDRRNYWEGGAELVYLLHARQGRPFARCVVFKGSLALSRPWYLPKRFDQLFSRLLYLSIQRTRIQTNFDFLSCKIGIPISVLRNIPTSNLKKKNQNRTACLLKLICNQSNIFFWQTVSANEFSRSEAENVVWQSTKLSMMC